jgi:L-lactate dehydrogenase complex protein LldG
MSNQEKFIRNIRTALGHPPDIRRDAPELFPQQPSEKTAGIIERVRRRGSEERQELLARMTEAGKPINLGITPVADETAAAAAIVELVRLRSPEWENQNQVCVWKHPLLEALDLGAAFKAEGVLMYAPAVVPSENSEPAREEIRRNTITAYIGITSADFALADTATLVMRTRSGQPRSMAVAPSIHLAVIRLDQILADLQELYALLRWDEKEWENGLSNYMSFISGPSKTADIEATMVHGAHGPREVHIFVIG